MIIFIYGQDTYRSRQKLNEIVDHYKKTRKSGLSLNFFEGENLNFQEFKNEMETVSMFKEKKLAVLKDIFSNQIFKEEFLKIKEVFSKSDDIVLIYQGKEMKKNDALYRFLKKNSKSQEFNFLEKDKLKSWVRKKIESYGGDIEGKALEKLLESVGSDLWQMENEIKKLVSFKDGKTITQEDVELLVGQKIDAYIFKTIDALAERRKDLALSLIHKHLEKGDNALYLLAMINFQFRNLLLIKDFAEKNTPYYLIIKQSGLHPFIVRKSFQQAKQFSFQKLKKIYQNIFQADINIKRGRILPEAALDLLIAGI